MTTTKKEILAHDESKQTFLIAAINDISGNIKFLDTKIALVMATVGVLIGIVAAGISSFSTTIAAQTITLPQSLKYGFNACVILYGLSTALVFVFGIAAVVARHFKPAKPSLWYFDNANTYPTTFEKDIRNLTDEAITDNLATELYNLNMINASKTKYAKKTMWAFAVSCTFAGTLLLIIMFYTMIL